LMPVESPGSSRTSGAGGGAVRRYLCKSFQPMQGQPCTSSANSAMSASRIIGYF